MVIHDTASLDTFLALLEYLYTDHAPIEEGDSVEIMVLANQYCLSRLVDLCELYISKEVDRCCSKNIERAEIDVIGLLMTSQVSREEFSACCRSFSKLSLIMIQVACCSEMVSFENPFYLSTADSQCSAVRKVVPSLHLYQLPGL